MNMTMASNSNSITIGVRSLTTPPVYRTTTYYSSHVQLHSLATPNPKPPGYFSFTLNHNLFNMGRMRRSLNILSIPTGTTLTRLNIISAINSGLEASITDSNESSAALKNAKIVVEESGDENKIQVSSLQKLIIAVLALSTKFSYSASQILRVDLTGDQAQRVFDQTLRDLGRTAPPVPGFRMQKGGKSSKIPKDFLIQMLGEERVTKFVIQEILNATMADYARKENLDVKDRKISTTQTAEELKRSFRPGNEFGFNVIIEPESSQDSC